jgi:hypothetical protein
VRALEYLAVGVAVAVAAPAELAKMQMLEPQQIAQVTVA